MCSTTTVSATRARCFPQVEFLWNPAGGGFVPYLRVDGRYRNNGYRATVANNPYVFQGRYGKNTAEYNGRLASGEASLRRSLIMYGRLLPLPEHEFLCEPVRGAGRFAAAGNTFDVLHADVSMWTLGGEIEARFSSSFGALLSVQYRWYDTKDRFRDSPDSPGLAYYLGLPDLTGRPDARVPVQGQVSAEGRSGRTGTARLYRLGERLAAFRPSACGHAGRRASGGRV